MALTVQQGAAILRRKLAAAVELRHGLIEAADAIVAANTPIYTGAYDQAIETKYGTRHSYVRIRGGALASAQPEVVKVRGETIAAGPDRVFWNLHGGGPPGPYPLRIEALGGPKSGDGRGMWQDAENAAKEVLAAVIAKVRSIG